MIRKTAVKILQTPLFLVFLHILFSVYTADNFES